MEIEDSDFARSLTSNEALAIRRGMMLEPHIEPLTNHVVSLRTAHPGWEFPDFDPLDGGVGADVLFLFEKPGPMTSKIGKGSGFISRNNDDPTAEATFRFMKEAELPRKRTIIWNVIPGWNGTRKIKAEELKSGVRELKRLLDLLPNLRTIVLVGRKAQRAKSLIQTLGLRVVESAHPSPIVRASRPNEWRDIPRNWSHAASS